MVGKLFGTDGVRGVANMDPMTAEMALQIGRATAYVCRRQEKNMRHRIVIGKDTRLSGYMLENALTAGICSMGVDVFLVGPMPTPGIAFLTQSMRADAGLVISASHNPYQDNGIKIFSRTGFKLPDADEAEIEELVLSGEFKDVRPTADEIGRARRIDDAIGRYIVFCKDTFPLDLDLEGMKIVLDCANGATYKVAPIIFTEMGADVIQLHCSPNGKNINAYCGSQYTQDLRHAVVESGANIGLGFDGDGDRLIAVDENGAEVNGDHILALLAKHYKDAGHLQNNLVVTTVMGNFGLYKALDAEGIDYEVAPVGDRYVLERMKEKASVLGGESSGHLICLHHHTTGDGIIAALQVLAAMRTSGRKLSELAGIMKLAPQEMINVDVAKKPPLEEIDELQAAIKEAEDDLAGEGRVLIRYSGTQSMCRVMVEGPTREKTQRITESLAEVVRRCIG